MNFTDFKNQAHAPKAKRMQGDRLYRWERNLSVGVTWALVKIFPWIKPNHVTGFSMLLLLVIFALNFSDLDHPTLFLVQLVLLYVTATLDRVDGEVARTTKRFSPQGMYYDKSYHFFYPFIFYSVIGFTFYSYTQNIVLLAITLLLAIATMYFRSFDLLRLSVAHKIKKSERTLHPVPDHRTSFQLPKNIVGRVLFYLVSMIYSLTIGFYFILGVILFYNTDVASYAYLAHITLAFIVTLYLGLWRYPQRHLISKEDL